MGRAGMVDGVRVNSGSIVVLLDTGTREMYSEDADDETRTRNPWDEKSTTVEKW